MAWDSPTTDGRVWMGWIEQSWRGGYLKWHFKEVVSEVRCTHTGGCQKASVWGEGDHTRAACPCFSCPDCREGGFRCRGCLEGVSEPKGWGEQLKEGETEHGILQLEWGQVSIVRRNWLCWWTINVMWMRWFKKNFNVLIIQYMKINNIRRTDTILLQIW